MKNQNDLIFSIVAGVIGVGFALGFFFTKREPIQPTPPTTVPTQLVALPNPEPAMANALSGGTNNAAGGFGGGAAGGRGMGGMGGGRPGVGMPGAPGGSGGGGKDMSQAGASS